MSHRFYSFLRLAPKPLSPTEYPLHREFPPFPSTVLDFVSRQRGAFNHHSNPTMVDRDVTSELTRAGSGKPEQSWMGSDGKKQRFVAPSSGTDDRIST